MTHWTKLLLTACSFLLMTAMLQAQSFYTLQGKIIDEENKPLSLATIRVLPADLATQSQTDGSFSLRIPAHLREISLQISHVGKEPVSRALTAGQYGQFQLIRLLTLSLKLTEVEVNAVRRNTASSNSSILFDREAIEQVQPLSVANVLNYLPGQTILRQGVSVQGIQTLNLRSATNPATLLAGGSSQARSVMETQNLNETFGLTVMVDGAPLSNNANMQFSNTSFMGMFSSNNITNPDGILADRAQRNGTLYSAYGGLYGGAQANTGLDLRSIGVESIEQIEVISGVASARYGDYTTGIVNIDRQAGITPLRLSLQHNDGTQLISLSKGMKLTPALGNINISMDYLHSNDDPRDKLKGFERIGAGLIWTYQKRKVSAFKNTLSVNYNTTLDRTKLDPDEGNQRMARFSNRSVNLSNRSNWTLRKSWIYDIEFRASYGVTRSESYDQWFLNSSSLIKIAEATETSTYEGRYGPGYYLAFHHIIGKPVNASARLQSNSIFKLSAGNTYKLSLGADYRYNANKGPGVLNDPARPRFDDQGYKNDRPRSFDDLSAMSNIGFYVENVFITRFLQKPLQANLGARADMQNGFFTAAPRINTSWQPLKGWSVSLAYGIATKAPGLSQMNPGNVYFDIPLLELYSSTRPEHQLYLVHTEVIKQEQLNLRPYSSATAEAGISWNTKPIKGSLFYSNRIMKNGFISTNTLVPVTVENYAYDTPVPGERINYYKDGSKTTYYLTYSGMHNGSYSRSNSVELILRTNKIRFLQTSFDLNTSYYHTYYRNSAPTVDLGTTGQSTVDYSKEAVFGIYNQQEASSTNIKSTLSANTHIPALRMTVVLTGEIFWMSRTNTYTSSIYPAGYLDKNGKAHSLTPGQAQSNDYIHLRRKGVEGGVRNVPSSVYSNMHLRLSKEIGDVLRLSFNAFNVFNIRPRLWGGTGYYYFNGQPSYSVAMAFSIK
ncbi:MAG: hypothetical protein BGO54_20350 [Sphingobacteriales bacterium 46-32]|nr:MAG: hypothetical protein BGO54_20350 [Sphingobacteriales bacterium 46-32]